MNTYRYILRYYIDKGFDTQARIQELVDFCEKARVEEVMLFLTPEELSPGHPTDDEIDTHIELALEIKDRLNDKGVDLSLNPWTTLYQVPRGRALRSGQNFRLMVGETGVMSQIVACPLCDNWQEWISTRFARLAKEIKPVAIWIEDDWRLHNHGAELGWGGCFCAEHMRLFSERVGREVNREELLLTILQPGEPHPWRDIWFGLSRDSIVQPMKRLCDAISEANAGTVPALMCSMPDQHSAEGRNWQLIKETIGANGRFLLRPHMPPYTAIRALRSTPAILRQTLACVDKSDAGPIQTEIYPELENSPRSGVFSKSGRYTIWQLVEAALFGSKGITLNHFDMMGNGIALDRAFEKHLGEAKDKLNALRLLEINDENAEGVQILFSPQIASHLRFKESVRISSQSLGKLSMSLQDPSQQGGVDQGVATVQQLVHNSVQWSETCSILGISQQLTSKIEPEKGPIFTSGKTLLAFSDDEIKRLLGGTVVLDAESVEVLLERGFGEQIGVTEANWNRLDDNPYGYESICEPDPSVYGLANPRMSAQRCANRILMMKAASDAKTRSTIHSPLYEFMCAGMLEFRNALGGRVISSCYPLGDAQFYMGYFNVFRAQFLQHLLAETPEWPWAAVENGLRCQRTCVKEGTLFTISNPTDDPQEQTTFCTSKDVSLEESEKAEWLYLNSDGKWETITAKLEALENGLRYTFEVPLSSLDFAFLLRKKNA